MPTSRRRRSGRTHLVLAAWRRVARHRRSDGRPGPISAVVTLILVVLGLAGHALAGPYAYIWTAVPVAKPGKPTAAPKPKIPTVVDVYDKSLDANALYTYRGHQITIYFRTGRTIRVLILHMAPNWQRIDYLAPDRLRGDVLVSNGHQEYRYDASNQITHRHAVAADIPPSSDIPVKYEQLRANYDLAFMPQPQVFAGRKTFVLTITRKASHVVARRLWIDAATGLVLKRDTYSETGKLNITVEFSDIDFHAHLTVADFTPPGSVPNRKGIRIVKDTREPEHAEDPVAVGAAGVVLGWPVVAPRGLDEFRLTSAAIVKRAGKNPVLHLRYSDGLVLVSVFEQKRTHTNRPTRVPPSMKPVVVGKSTGHLLRHASLVTLNWDMPTVNMTMIGEVSTNRMINLADAFDSAR